ncbi:ankyrin repeat domain-containing protein [Agaribacterium sp. ZY112]|uniref:ankyrin repeat domain-containing protein n=1 Tax=Agaribacterium sp. ZY112 TaxID=3233574 RepID=UPI0035236C1A
MSFSIDQQVIFAARSGNLELLQERVEAGGNINHQDPSHGSAITVAINSNNLEVLDWLIAQGADLNQENSHGITPLDQALRFPNTQVVRLLAYNGAKLGKTVRSHYKARLEECLKHG